MTPGELQEAYATLKQTYLVENLILPSTRYVFVLESPHVEELKYGVPVAGRSGQSMTRIVPSTGSGHRFEEAFDLPLGRLLLAYRNGKVDHPLLNTLGLMNACQIPMQPAAYADDTQERFSDFLAILEAIRSRPASKTYRDDRLNLVRELILSDLRRQLQPLTQRELHIIPCGRVADTFFSLIDVTSPTWHVHAGIPHPARNQWPRDDVAGRVRSLIELN